MAHPQMLLHRASMCARREALGILTAEAASDVSEAEVVLDAKWVTEERCYGAYWVNYAMYALRNMRARLILCGYLDANGMISYGDMFAWVCRYFRTRTDSEVCQFCIQSTKDRAHCDLLSTGKTAH
ncbi:hypothetical protein [Streptomyces sp. CC224B]|uniref:hypothetical protein n=1 Tax=Streptomyces sp. CC224B TaxID=3044571 RepID=UPI0024A9D283|nr:hypothetical protein [Streptomyces sp. CC224B]